MQRIRSWFRVFFFGIVNNLIKLKPFMLVLNYLFERVPYNIVVYITRHIIIPNNNFNWVIKLYNNTRIVTRIYKDNPKTWQFALSYKWHDRGLNMLETVLVDYLPENSLWIDCGANLGLRSLTALSGNMQVFMIEPNEETNSLCLERCKLNNFRNFKIIPVGISNLDTEKTFYVDNSSYLSTLNEGLIDSKNVEKAISINVRKLDTLFKDKIDSDLNVFIKIDIEGHEIEALEGAENLINVMSPTLLIEINEKDEHIEYIFDIMREKGYEVYEINDLTPKSKFLKKCLKGDSNNKRNDFLFVKDESLINFFERYSIDEGSN